jgi:hypothetical protein
MKKAGDERPPLTRGESGDASRRVRRRLSPNHLKRMRMYEVQREHVYDVKVREALV